LPGSKSSYKTGLSSEHKVIALFLQKNYHLVAQRYKSPFSEIDIILKDPSKNNLILIEVKTLISSKNWAFFRVSPQQEQRLSNAFEYFINNSKIPVHFHLALVLRSGEINIVKDFLNF
jgi:putative endonuclease